MRYSALIDHRQLAYSLFSSPVIFASLFQDTLSQVESLEKATLPLVELFVRATQSD